MEKETQMGPLNSFKQLENIEKNIKATIEQGGKIRCGGKRSAVSNFITDKIGPNNSFSAAGRLWFLHSIIVAGK